MWKPLLFALALLAFGCGSDVNVTLDPSSADGYDAPSSCLGVAPEDFSTMPNSPEKDLSLAPPPGFFPRDRFYASQKLGNTIEITDQDINDPKRILEPNIAELDHARNYEAGAWVLTLRSVVNLGTNPAANVLNTAFARISFGDGSAVTPVELDISNGASIQLPCGALQVDIVQPEVPAGSPFILPPSQAITATVHRGFSSSPGTRTFYFWATGLAFAGVVPVGAKNVMALGIPFMPPVTLGAGIFLYAGQGASAAVPALLRFYNATELEAIQTQGAGRAMLPGQATKFILDGGGIAGTLLAVEFGIQL